MWSAQRLVEARCERIAREGGDWFTDYAVPSAVLNVVWMMIGAVALWRIKSRTRSATAE